MSHDRPTLLYLVFHTSVIIAQKEITSSNKTHTPNNLKKQKLRAVRHIYKSFSKFHKQTASTNLSTSHTMTTQQHTTNCHYTTQHKHLTVVRHGQNRNLCDRAITTGHTTGPLIHSRQIRVHVARKTTTTGDFLPGSRHLNNKQKTSHDY